MNNVAEPESTVFNHQAIKKELLYVLEKARGRLAIAIAEESKITPGGRRKHYLETADRMRLFIEGLRKEENSGLICTENWASALEALHHTPLKNGAQSLCDYLRHIVAELNSDEA